MIISDIRLNATSLALGDIAEGEGAAREVRRGCDDMSPGSSMPRYPHKSASARVSARLADEDDRSDTLCAEFWPDRPDVMMRFSDGRSGIGGTGGTGSEVGEGVQTAEGQQLLKRDEPFWLVAKAKDASWLTLRRSPALDTRR